MRTEVLDGNTCQLKNKVSGTCVRIDFLFYLMKLTYVKFQQKKRKSIRTGVLDGNTCQLNNKLSGTYVRIDFLFYLMKLTYVSFNRKKENPFEQKSQTETLTSWG